MQKENKVFAITAVIIVLPVLAFGLSYGLNHVVPLGQDNSGIYGGVFQLMMVLIGIGIPFVMLKLLSKASHEIDPHEKIIEMRDIPRDKAAMNRKINRTTADSSVPSEWPNVKKSGHA